MRRNIKTRQWRSFWKKTQSGKSRDYCDASSSKIFFPSTRKKKPGVFIDSSCLESVSEKLRFHDEVWKAGLTIEINLRFQIPPAWCRLCSLFFSLSRVNFRLSLLGLLWISFSLYFCKFHCVILLTRDRMFQEILSANAPKPKKILRKSTTGKVFQ